MAIGADGSAQRPAVGCAGVGVDTVAGETGDAFRAALDYIADVTIDVAIAGVEV